jgi:type IV pilus assembly protein PilF
MRALAIVLSGVLCLLLAGCGGVSKREAAGLMPKESPADLYVDTAAAYYQRGQMDAALDRGLRAVDEDKNNPRAHYVLAIVYQRLGRKDEAEKHFTEAVRLDPNNPDFLNAQGTVLCLQNRYTDAITQFKKALANPLYKTPEVALMNAADCSRRAHQSGEYERYLRQALTARPDYAPALFGMAKLSYERGTYPDARNYMARYSRVGAVTPEALLLASQIEARLGNRAESRAIANTLRQRFPDAPEIMQL